MSSGYAARGGAVLATLTTLLPVSLGATVPPGGRDAVAVPHGGPRAGLADTVWTLDGIEYREMRGRGVLLRFAPADSLVAIRVLGLLEEEPPLPGLGPEVPAGVTAVLAHSGAALDQLTGGRVPEWRAGVAVPERSLLIVPLHEGQLILEPEGRRTLRHEWAHLGLHQSLAGARVPRWFDEGYAQWASGGWDAEEAWRLRVLLALGRTPPLDSLSLSWPSDRASASAAYLLAASAVAFLLEESGERGLELLVARWRERRSFDEALRATFGVTQGQFEEDWRRHVRARYGWLFVVSRSAVFWMLLALVLLFMARSRQRRNRERMARLRAGEGPDAPAFWEGGPPREGRPAQGHDRSVEG